MKKVLIITVIALATLALAPLAINEKGYVLIAFNDYTIEGTIVAFVIMTLISVASLYFVIKFIKYLLSLYGVTRFKWLSRAENRKLTNLQTGLWQFVNYDFNGAQQTLAKAPVPKGWENLSAAILARSALELEDKESARRHLEKVSDSDTNNVAQMLVASEQAELAKDAMGVISSNKKASSQELANFAEFLVAQQDWQKLAGQLNRFEKKHALNEQQWQTLFERYFAALDKTALQQAYSQLPKKLKEKAELSYLTNLALIAPAEAEKSLLKLAKADHYRHIWAVLAKAKELKLTELQKFVQTRLKKLPEDNTLLISLAYIAKAQGDFELACKVFNKALTQQSAAQHWRVAAYCFAETQQNDKALALFKQYA